MDFVPILISILFAQFDGFSLLSENQDGRPVLYHYSDLEAGSELRLQCLNDAGNFVTVKTAMVGSENYNAGYPYLPVRRADFGSLPENCTVTTVTTIRVMLNPCLMRTDEYVSERQTYRVLYGNKELNLWNNLETVRFIQGSVDSNNLRLVATLADVGSPNRIKFSHYQADEDVREISGTSPIEYGGNGKVCPSGFDPANGGDQWSSSTEFGVSFYTEDFLSTIDFFDYRTYDYTLYGYDVTPDDVIKGIDKVRDIFYAEGAEGMIIDPDDAEVWGLTIGEWRTVATLIASNI